MRCVWYVYVPTPIFKKITTSFYTTFSPFVNQPIITPIPVIFIAYVCSRISVIINLLLINLENIFMADIDHPKTPVEKDKDAELPRTQPKSPKHEGIDPLTEGDTMYPSTDTQADSKALARENETQVADENQEDADEVEETVADQKAVKKTEDKVAEKKADEKASDSKPKSEGSDTPKSGTSEPKTS